MKDYKQVSDSVFRKAEERMNEKKRRSAVIWRRSLIASGMAAVLIVGVGIWKNESIRGLLDRDPHTSDISLIEEDPTVTASETIAVTTESRTAEKTTKQAKNTTSTATRTSTVTSKTSSTASSSADSTISEKADGNTSHANGGGTTVRTEQNNTQRTTVTVSGDKNTSAKTTQTTSRAETTTTKRTSATASTTTRRINTTTTTTVNHQTGAPQTTNSTTRQTHIPTHTPTVTDTTWVVVEVTTTSQATTTTIAYTHATMPQSSATTESIRTIDTGREFTVTETEAGEWLIEGCPTYCYASLCFEADEPVSGRMHVIYNNGDHEETVYNVTIGDYETTWMDYYNYGSSDAMTVYFECDDPAKIRLVRYKLNENEEAYIYYEERKKQNTG